MSYDILAKRFGIPMEGYTYFFTFEETIPHKRMPGAFWNTPCALGADLSLFAVCFADRIGSGCAK